MSRSLKYIAITLVGLVALAGSPVFSSGFVGQVVSSEAKLDDRAVPAGSTLHGGAVISTTDDPAVIHLATGQLVQVAQNSSARFNGDSDAVRVAVITGELAYRESDGQAVALPAGTSAMLTQDDPAIGGGTPVSAGDPDEKVAICHLQDSTPDLIQLCNFDDYDSDQCDWERMKVERRDLGAHFAHGDIYADKDLRTPEMNPDAECGKKVAWWWAGGAALAAGIILADDDSSSPAPASPIVP